VYRNNRKLNAEVVLEPFRRKLQGQSTFGFEKSDCRILLALYPKLECASRRQLGWISPLIEGFLQQAGFTEEASVQ
jgi:hypothetical protein